MKITPLAADSLGARSMATLVETTDVTILIDPGVRVAPFRYNLSPHPSEEDRQKELWRRIKEAAKKADILTVSHHHYDHHNPDAPSIYRGKLAYLKDRKAHINRSQRERASVWTRARQAMSPARPGDAGFRADPVAAPLLRGDTAGRGPETRGGTPGPRAPREEGACDRGGPAEPRKR